MSTTEHPLMATTTTIKLDPETKKILELTIPDWSHLLKMANYDIKKLDIEDQDDMNYDGTSCYIGELHNHSSFFDLCEECAVLAFLAPYVFKSKAAIYQPGRVWGNSPNESICKPLKKLGFNQSPKGQQAFMNYMADHIKADHKNIIIRATKLKANIAKLRAKEIKRLKAVDGVDN